MNNEIKNPMTYIEQCIEQLPPIHTVQSDLFLSRNIYATTLLRTRR
jgi:hypothetical protein